VKIDELEAFVSVAKTSNISAAAKRLGIPQATLSDRLRSLEAALGSLFQRRSRPPWVKLTELGARLLPDAVDAVDAADRIRVARAAGRRNLPVRIGVNQSVEHTWLFSWLERLRAQHPALELALRVDTTDALDDGLSSADLDLAIAARPLGEREVQTQQLPSLAMAFVGSAARHRKGKYRFEEIAGAGLVTFQAGSQPHRSLVKLLRSAEIDAARVDVFSSIPSMVKAVQRGFGVATLPEELAAQAPEQGLRVLPCEVSLPALPVWVSWPPPVARDAKAALASLLAFAREAQSQRSKR
jgi:DNA-binding transcriptional LysR family regulator